MGHSLRKYNFKITYANGYVTEWHECAYDLVTARNMMIRFLSDKGVLLNSIEFLGSEVVIL